MNIGFIFHGLFAIRLGELNLFNKLIPNLFQFLPCGNRIITVNVVIIPAEGKVLSLVFYGRHIGDGIIHLPVTCDTSLSGVCRIDH
nr:hypothetical protein KXZ65_17410 [Pectobacterium sp. PL152]